MVERFANSGDPDQTPCSAASDLGLCCLPVTRLGFSSLQWVNVTGLRMTVWLVPRSAKYEKKKNK